ncbi:MAG: ABC transporter permease [Bdellovibrionota bacterium]
MFNSVYLLSIWALVYREVVRFFRQMSRVIGALGTPLLFWFLIGSGVGTSFQSPFVPEGMSYLEFLFPGTLALILLMTAMFSSISIIQDRQEGFLQSILVAPVASATLVGGKLLGGSLLSVFQALLLLLLVPFIGIPYSFSLWLYSAFGLFLFSVAMSSISFFFAWKIPSVQGFHAVMNLLFLPLWVLSGALFPASAAPGWLKVCMYLNPVTYGVASIRYALNPAQLETFGSPSISLSWLVLGGLAVLGYLVDVWIVKPRR